MPSKIAFFDIDGTVFRSSLLIELVEALIEAGVFPRSVTDEYQAEYQAWRNREGDYDAYIQAVIETYKRHIKGVHYGVVADLGRAMVTEQAKVVYRYTRDLIKKLKDDGYYVVAISHSPKAILDEFCSAHGFDKVYGRIHELGPNDRFTGAVVDEHLIQNKANIVNRVLQDHDGAVSETLAVGDTESDIPMLEAVDRAICFNPNMNLYTHAKRVGWEIVVERKDVIYAI